MYDQVVSKGEDIVPTNELSIVPRQRRKWLNIVLDVNGVLGQCIPKFELGRVRRVHEMRDNIFSHETPTIVGRKAVYARQNLREFLRQLSNIALRIVVWTSMVRSNADLVASYLFMGNSKPYRILAQDQCKMIVFPPRRLSRPGQTAIFMKVLSEQLFHESSPFTKENTLLIDDSREKSICNERGNAIFLKPWTHEDENDNVLLGRLLPWLESLHNGCPAGQLWQYVNANRIGLGLPTRDDYLVQEMMAVMREASRERGARYEILWLNVVVERRPCRR